MRPLNRPMTEIGNTHKRLLSLILAGVLAAGALVGCGQATPAAEEADQTAAVFASWSEVEEAGRDQTVTILMWGGNELVNTYMDTTVSSYLKETYNITLNRVPMNPPDYLSLLLNEKTAGVAEGSADLLWINAENFRTAKEGGLLWGPYDQLLENQTKYYETSAGDLNSDSGIPIEGMEAIWGRAQLVLTTDTARVEAPPKSYKALLEWAKANPGRFTYPNPMEDFAGSAFVRSALYELTGESDWSADLTEEAFKEKAQPVFDYFNELKPYLWREGTVYPSSQAQLDELFKNNEVDFTIGFELGKTAGQVAAGAYPETAEAYVFDTGTIGNAHYLAVPFNAPQKAAALLTINALQSPELQLEKFKPAVWGDMPAFDAAALSEEEQAALKAIEAEVFPMPLEALAERRLPELKAVYIDWIEMLWSEIAGASNRAGAK
ncbi:ABC transporter substrate-binding protein [Acidaminobacter sp.]|uniref:ABC transporter substrate-binding protein n=1 Tax=Acidaminobacter sp. TaxID=1872102 RepID=UPI00137D8066|nr:ABC transporter substrate-binding protein [Acidaminobacter sp.]MDK9711315.1 ABC transporter substrate-binding protein [Acidaminobacter sp.]MZQ97122.1 ABC transporter substrate-binding protein [Acidaminobacter sp.]